MKNLKNALATMILAVIIMLGTSAANAGILMTDAVETNPCTETKEKVDYGIIVTGLTGIIVTGFTGIIVTGVSNDTPTVNCGIIVTG